MKARKARKARKAQIEKLCIQRPSSTSLEVELVPIEIRSDYSSGTERVSANVIVGIAARVDEWRVDVRPLFAGRTRSLGHITRQDARAFDAMTWRDDAYARIGFRFADALPSKHAAVLWLLRDAGYEI
jgi:hypothetical protein